MSTVQALIDRQLGIYCRLNYDYAVRRLTVEAAESFYGLQSANTLPALDQDPPIFACRFAETAGFEHILALANEDGKVAIQDTSTPLRATTVESFQCHNNAVFDLAWAPGKMNFVTVSGDHTACLWDVGGGGAPRALHVFAGHSRSVKSAVFRPGDPAVFATGARDGHVLLWDARASAAPAHALKPDNCLAACHSAFAPRTPGSHGKRRVEPRAASVTGLAFQHEHTLLSCGECDGNIKAWDLRKNYSAHRREPLPAHSIPYCGGSTRNGYCSLLVDASRVRLYASCMDHVIYCFNVATYCPRPERRYSGHENGTFYIKTCLSPDGRYLVSGSSDKYAYVWSVESARPLVRLAGHRAEVTCAAWRRGAEPALVTCSDDARHMIWRVGPEDLPAGAAPPPARAEPAPRPDEAAPTPRTPSTPAALKRRAPAPAPASDTKRPRPAPERRTKRCLAQLMEAAREPDEEQEQATKRARTASPPPARASPPHSPPTKDLPDFALRGEAPHLRLMSPVKRRRDAAGGDWLSALGRAKRARCEGAAAPCERAAAPLAAADNLPARRAAAPERGRAARGPLLRYFTVAAKK